MPQNNTVTLILKLYCSMAQSYNYLLLLVSVLKLVCFWSVVFRAEKYGNMTCCKYGAYNTFLHFNILTWYHGIYILHHLNILYETYDSVLQFVHFSANSHNFHINTVMTFLNNLIFCIYGL